MSKKGIPGGKFDAASFMSVITEVQRGVSAAFDYMKEAEQQRTERERIAAECHVQIAQVQAFRELMLEYLNRSFDERHHLFQELFTRLDQSISQGNLEFAAATLNTMVEISKQSPFKALADAASFQKAFTDNKTEWKF